jgi:hypothetical protein
MYIQGNTDNSFPLTNNLKIETGIKTSLVKTNNTTLYFNTPNNQEVFNEALSTQFKYSENINSAYLNINKNWNKWTIQLGMRLENTAYNGDQYSYASKRLHF